MSYRDGNDYPPQSSRVGKNAGKSRHLLCLDGRCLSSTSRLCAFPCSVHPAQGKRCAPCLRASSASCLQSPATIYPHLQAASSICSSATLPSYSRRCEIGGSFHHPPRFSFSSPATAKSSRPKLLKRYLCRTFPHLWHLPEPCLWISPNFDCCLLLFSNKVFDLEVVGLIFPFHSHNGIIHHRSRQLLSQRTGQPPHSLKSPTIFVPKCSPCCYMGENWFILADFCCKKWIAIKSDITRTDCISSNMGLNFCYTRAIWTFVQRQNLKLPISESFWRKAGGSYNQPIFESLSASRLWGPLTQSLSGPLWDFHLEPNKHQLLERMGENGARCKKAEDSHGELVPQMKAIISDCLNDFLI